MLTFMEYSGRNRHGMRLAKYVCHCGNYTITEEASVKKGLTKSCGCGKKEIGPRSVTHGLTKHPLYTVWSGMISRCYYEKNNRYHRYGGRGVRVCDQWRNSFKSFYDWAILNGWGMGLQLDKDTKGDGLLYSPDTCCFITRKQNSNATSRNRIIEYNGIAYTLSQLADIVGVKSSLISARLADGYSIADAVSKQKNRNRRMVFCESNSKIYTSPMEAAIRLNLNIGNIRQVCSGDKKTTGGLKFRYAEKGDFINHAFGALI